ncbi:VOC family protein [Hyphomonas johnsonii]|jgi:catechol 2,3-dioxygenase-like lactoylglutathione lyase family enzyme|uniref:Glyoxalase family protein n=1 Tax=Hyphomonas johnsonii MHS-2 TaxID=1280950 RepID=A0A059FUH1_9PROT|nr:VOC family protein [Hyphomonas johnsonii]KCZ94350.1 glyoxalase family protein [Hyphomonas johnsonii MHS-2]
MGVLPEQRVSVITIGVSDLDGMIRFYTDVLGFEDRGVKNEVAFFNAGGLVIGLWDEKKLAADAGVAADRAGAFKGFALAYNARSADEVDEIFGRLESAGVRIPKPPHKAYWGGYSGYFADPEGNAWEVAHNPFWPIDEAGRVSVPLAKEQ